MFARIVEKWSSSFHRKMNKTGYLLKLMKNIPFIIFLVCCCFSCKNKDANKPAQESGVDMSGLVTTVDTTLYDHALQTVITGNVSNREVYPNQRELTLIIPYFNEMSTKITSPIHDDGSFAFTFYPYTCRDVKLQTFAGNILVRPGDSLHVEIDFRHIDRLEFSGTAGKLNRDLYAFTEQGYYIGNYTNSDYSQPLNEFKASMDEEFLQKKQRLNDFIKDFAPEKDVIDWAGILLEVDYHERMLQYPFQHKYRTGDSIPQEAMADVLTSVQKLFTPHIITGGMFELGRQYLYTVYDKSRNDPETNTEKRMADILNSTRNGILQQFIVSQSFSAGMQLNQTEYFETYREYFDRAVTLPFLREPILRLYNDKMKYKENPKPLSDALLYGRQTDMARAESPVKGMIGLLDIIKENEHKVIYLNFWSTWCSPCLQNLKAEQKLIEKYTGKDIVFVSACLNSDMETWKKLVETNHLAGVHYFFDLEESRNIMKKLQFRWVPHFLLLNKKGIIVDYGFHLSADYPATAERIDKLLTEN